MQYNQPFCGTGYPNLGQFYNHPFPPQPTVYPEIIGEGEVASVVYPDGSIHLYFIPLNKRLPTFHPNSSFNPYFNNSMGAYYVRSISNPMPSAMFNQQCQQMYAGRPPLPRPFYYSDCNMNIPSPGFQLKFHNDCWTSTTDLHCFIPRLRRCDWLPVTELKGCASIQVDIPVKETTFCNQEVTCARPCICSVSDNDSGSGNETVKCYCDKVMKSRRSKSCVPNKTRSRKRLNIKKINYKLKSKKSDVQCECKEPNTTDKAITTYAEQASCAVENERNTQTCRSCTVATSARGTNSTVNRSDVKMAELWFPKLSQGEQALRSKSSEKIVGIYETSCSSATCCCSTDTETRGRDT